VKSISSTYRLNVRMQRPEEVPPEDCKTIQTLKYLRLRNTDVSSLPKQIRELRLLEMLRQTKIHVSCTERINLRKLKNLLAGHGSTASRTGESLSTVRMPANISKVTDMEVYIALASAYP